MTTSHASINSTDGRRAPAVDRLVLQRGERFAQNPNTLQIDAAFRLVQHRQQRLLQQQLERLAALALTTGKADIEVARDQFGHGGDFADFLDV